MCQIEVVVFVIRLKLFCMLTLVIHLILGKEIS
jgi:hypothetical protein